MGQQARFEMKNICSLNHNSILRSSNETLKQFSWISIWKEVQRNVPTLVKLIKCLLPKSDFKFVAMLIARILKKHCKQMSLVQRAISVLLFGNATNKQVIISEHHLEITLYNTYRYTSAYSHLWFVCQVRHP